MELYAYNEVDESGTRVCKLELNGTRDGINLTHIALVFTRSRSVARLSASVRYRQFCVGFFMYCLHWFLYNTTFPTVTGMV